MLRNSKEKKCKGSTPDTKGFGCGQRTKYHKYGLCTSKCYPDWLLNTEAGKIKMQKAQLRAKREIESKERKKTREQKRKLDSSSAMKLADTYFSRYVRLFHADLNGNCTCYTCGTIVNLKECHNGHYQKREHKATRYHVNNARPQCPTCNGDTKHNGKQDIFRRNLVYEIGEESVLEIESLARSTFKVNAKWYRDIADKYREKLNELQSSLKVKYW